MIKDESFDALPDADALNVIGTMVDLACDRADSALTSRALALADRLAARTTVTAEMEILLHYFRANAFENQSREVGRERSWSWELAHFDKVLLDLRRAVNHACFATIDPFRQCQILTNLGNQLNAIGRPVEALASWDRAIARNPRFAMALGNRGHGLIAYARSLYDGGHAGLLMGSAREALKAASDIEAIYDSPASLAHAEQFEAMSDQLAGSLPLDTIRDDLHREFKLGRSRAERAYRKWALENRLFLNPLNDLGPFSTTMCYICRQ